jgi:hypothetical protein
MAIKTAAICMNRASCDMEVILEHPLNVAENCTVRITGDQSCERNKTAERKSSIAIG